MSVYLRLLMQAVPLKPLLRSSILLVLHEQNEYMPIAYPLAHDSDQHNSSHVVPEDSHYYLRSPPGLFWMPETHYGC